jgi:hypothetical protein
MTFNFNRTKEIHFSVTAHIIMIKTYSGKNFEAYHCNRVDNPQLKDCGLDSFTMADSDREVYLGALNIQALTILSV